MIIKASQRAGAKQLANHLLNANDNEHIEIHEVNGFMADTLPEALQESYALSKSTRCKQHLFSVSLNPPVGEVADISLFEQTLNKIEEKMNLKGQPRVVVFHEKHGRRHAHAVWSRIFDDGQKLKAAHLSFYQKRLMEISKEIYLEQGWKLPNGFIDREQRNPLNFSRSQWQQAKRGNDNPQSIKMVLKECWSLSKSRDGFVKKMERKGYYLAKGDRRGFVAVDWRGEVYSLSRWLGVKNKELREKLGTPKELPTVQETKDKIDQRLSLQIQSLINDLKNDQNQRFAFLQSQKTKLKIRHNTQRTQLEFDQNQRWVKEAQARQKKIAKGIKGFWARLTGQHRKVVLKNEAEAYACFVRDRNEKDQLISMQLDERQSLQNGIKHMQKQHRKEIQELKESIFSKVPENNVIDLHEYFQKHSTIQLHEQSQQMSEFDLEI